MVAGEASLADPLADEAGLAAPASYDLYLAVSINGMPRDVIAGVVLATMLVPVGIAYAAASGVPGIYGLYATIVPLLAYAVFGPSRILVLGPDSSLAAVILGVVLPAAPTATRRPLSATIPRIRQR